VQVAQSANPQNIGFIHAMTKLNFWSVILDLFFTFVWNNFVHNVVERILAVALTNPLLREFKLTVLLSFPLLTFKPPPRIYQSCRVVCVSCCVVLRVCYCVGWGADQLLRDLKLVDRLVESASRTDVGYAGALATVATTIIKSSAGDPQVSQYLDGTHPPTHPPPSNHSGLPER
jgi:hypothetical protein